MGFFDKAKEQGAGGISVAWIDSCKLAVMFFLVHYGDAEILLMNSNCQMKILIERMTEVAKCKKTDVIDLTDMHAVVLKLNDLPPEAYGNEILHPRGNYILIKVKAREDEHGQQCNEYIPLLQGLETVNPEYLGRLSSRQVNPDAYIKDKNLRSVGGPPKSRNRAESRQQNSVMGKGRNSNLPVQGNAGRKTSHRE